ncbi:unnamed protein product, partial [Amoebophrya sp. A120]
HLGSINVYPYSTDGAVFLLFHNYFRPRNNTKNATHEETTKEAEKFNISTIAVGCSA